ncbi:hypothetical protein H6F89_15700 [Cyanobacteria bacterium FACHB-63]|nr:hypothetical protein [Cyanobacteria bacterium FACHB-63]
MAASAILAGLRLEEDGIYRLVQKNMRKQEKLRTISYGMVCWSKLLRVELSYRSSYQILVPAKVSRTVSAGATS